METVLLSKGSRSDIELLLEIAKKIGLDLEVASAEKAKKARLKALAKTFDALRTPADLSMDEIVEEVRTVREQNSTYGKKSSS